MLLYQFSKPKMEFHKQGADVRCNPIRSIAKNLKSSFPISPIHLSAAKCWAELMTVLVGSGFFWLIET